MRFDILAVNPEELYERRGTVRRIVGLRQEWFNHPNALRIPEELFSSLHDAFRRVHPEFNYYGPTEYRGSAISELQRELRAKPWLSARRNRPDPAEAEAVVEKILEIAQRALANEQVLLVLGP